MLGNAEIEENRVLENRTAGTITVDVVIVSKQSKSPLEVSIRPRTVFFSFVVNSRFFVFCVRKFTVLLREENEFRVGRILTRYERIFILSRTIEFSVTGQRSDYVPLVYREDVTTGKNDGKVSELASDDAIVIPLPLPTKSNDGKECRCMARYNDRLLP